MIQGDSMEAGTKLSLDDSPAMITRSTRRKTLLSGTAMDITENSETSVSCRQMSKSPKRSPKKTPLRQTGGVSIDSPARNTRSASRSMKSTAGSTRTANTSMNVEEEHDEQESASSSSNTDTLKATPLSSGTQKRSVEYSTRQAPTSILNSSVRRGNKTPGTADRRVGFRSPEMCEFNIGSPSMNLTPLPSAKKRITSQCLLEDTVQIEADMNALLNGVQPVAKFPAIAFPEDQTIELEGNMEQLLQDNTGSPPMTTSPRSTDESKQSSSPLAQEQQSMDLENTVELENNLGSLLSEMDPRRASVGSTVATAKEEKTVELEFNMEALLSSTGGDKTEVSMLASPSTIRNRRSFSLRSSERFSLVPESRLSVDTDGAATEPDATGSMDWDVTEVELNVPVQPLTLTTKEVVADKRVLDSLESAQFSTDILNTVLTALQEIQLTDTVDAMYSAVSEQVISTTDPEVDLNSALVVIDEANEVNLKNLQTIIRQGSAQEMIAPLQELSNAVSRSEKSKWSDWQLSVVETLKQPLVDMRGEVEDATVSIHESIEALTEAAELVVSLENNQVRQAKLKSYTQRKVRKQCSSWLNKNKVGHSHYSFIMAQKLLLQLETEIQQMEAQLQSESLALSSMQDRQKIVSTDNILASSNTSLRNKSKRIKNNAESLERKFKNAKGLHIWKTESMAESQFVFHLVGPSPESCVELSMKLDETVICRASVKTDIFKKHRQYHCTNRFQAVSEYIHTRVEDLCKELNGKSLSDRAQIPELLQRSEWKLGRIEHTALELLVLRRRYKAILARSEIDGSTNLQVEADFESETKETRLGAIFELSRGYPFAPLDVRLDVLQGDINVEALQRLLVKNAKPGVGYLSRTCDVIAASLRQHH